MKTVLLAITKDEKIFVNSDTQYVLLAEKSFSKEPFAAEFVFEKPAVSAEIILLYVLPKNGELNVTTIANHKAPHTKCLTKVRGILADGSVSNYTGKILIEKSAQQTSSFLDDKVLVVGEKTKNNSRPILMIEADDVSASHGASTGRINEDEIYYLQSRGLNKIEAEKLIIEGFFAQLTFEIKDEKIKQEVEKSLGKVEF